MKKITLLTAFLVSFIGFSQTNKQNIQTYLDNNRVKLGLTAQDVSDWIIESEGSSSTTKITNYRVVQRYQGIELYDAQSNVWVKDNRVINMGNRFKSNIAQKVNTTAPTLSVIQAISSAYTRLGITKPAIFTITETKVNKHYLLSDGLQQDPITAKLAYQLTSDDHLKLAWAFQFYTPDAKHYWDVRIDALDGSVLAKNDLTISCNFGDANHKSHDHKTNFNFENYIFNNLNSSMLVVTPGSYRVVPYNYESPNHSPFQLITTAGNALASPNGWHDSNALGGTSASLKYTYTRGNNVLAQEDANGDNGTGIRPDGGATLNFDFPQYAAGVGQTQQPTSYTSASTTNLFYMNNIMHDIWYQYGFDEANGNYQQNNLGRGGVTSATGDYVQADSQDGYSQTTQTLNNANFTPTNDGVRPRIQMFLWTLGAPPTNFITVNSPASIAGPRTATTNVFEGTDRIPVPVAPNGIVSDLALYANNPTPPGYNSACQAATNPFDLSGKIVLVRRGGCFFNLKVKNAQDAGATAVIVMDSIPVNPTRLSMSSTGILGITIPAVFVTKEIGDELVAQLANGPVNVKLESPSDLYLYADGDFDNVIIGHEYGHGISNRLVGGGLAGCMTNYEQMGEGWSDWFGLMNQIKTGDAGADPKEVGTYVTNQPVTGAGIRDFPYSTDLALNPRTFADSNTPIPTDPADTAYRYVVGEFWTSCLWDLTWAYINQYGFDPDIYNGIGGNNMVMRLVADALKLETCNGTNIVTGRDNILAADLAATGGANQILIAQVFSRRGVGFSASSGSANDCNDQVQDFTPLAVNSFTGQTETTVRIYPNPSNGLVNVRINKFVGKVNFQVIDLNGRVVFNQTDENFNIEKTLNLNNFQSGLYILKIVADNLNYSQKLVKN
ncbi:MAG: T9SS-dependent M36 family metallopeptidase [Burkholderiales bacterium]|nr:T9SS-dependent M36 family metallopeptidase [Flavobacterium sp.]